MATKEPGPLAIETHRVEEQSTPLLGMRRGTAPAERITELGIRVLHTPEKRQKDGLPTQRQMEAQVEGQAEGGRRGLSRAEPQMALNAYGVSHRLSFMDSVSIIYLHRSPCSISGGIEKSSLSTKINSQPIMFHTTFVDYRLDDNICAHHLLSTKSSGNYRIQNREINLNNIYSQSLPMENVQLTLAEAFTIITCAPMNPPHDMQGIHMI